MAATARQTNARRGMIGLTLAVAISGASAAGAADLKQLIDGPQRSAENKARDGFRKPLEVLTFFGIKETSRVIEIAPGAVGYWTEILAPYLKDKGHYIATGPVATPGKAGAQKAIADFAAKLASSPAHLFGRAGRRVRR